MLAGEPPFTGPTPQAVIAKRVLEPVPHVRTLRDSVPEPVEQALTRALAKAPADRFATAAEFARALAHAGASAGARLSRAERSRLSDRCRRRRRPLRGTLGLVARPGRARRAARLAREHRPETRANAGPKRLAVLPFENLGRPEDEYFADGVTDEVRGKLAALPGLEVIARTSSASTTDHEEPAADRAGAGRRVPADGDGPVGEGHGRAEPGAREPRAGPGLDRLDQVAGTLRSPAHRRVPGAGRRGGPRGRGAWRGARRGRARAARGAADGEPCGLRRLPQGRGGGRRHWRSTLRRTGGRSTTTSARWPWTPPLPSPGPSSRGRTRRSTGPRLRRPGRRPRARPPSARWRLRRSCPRATSPWRTTTTCVQQDLDARTRAVQTGVAARAQGRPVPDCGRPRTRSPSGIPRRGSRTCERRRCSIPARSRPRQRAVYALVGLRRYPEALQAADRGARARPDRPRR